jgi:hypothetical protein
LRLLVRHHGWLRDEAALKQSLERSSRSIATYRIGEDEHYALSQLVLVAPQETEHAERLHELNSTYDLKSACRSMTFLLLIRMPLTKKRNIKITTSQTTAKPMGTHLNLILPM